MREIDGALPATIGRREMSGSAVMSDVEVQPVTNRRQRKEFLDLPFQQYAGDPNWIPPLLYDQRALVGFKAHPFYQDAEAQAFLAYRNGRPCGRIVGILNHAHNRFHNERRGFFGFFESIDDAQVAEALFGAVGQWLAQRDIHELRGPCNPSLNYECGLLIEGFDTPPYFMMTYNKPYYGRLIEQCGFQKSHDMYAFWGHINQLGTLDPKLGRIAEQAAERFNVRTRPIDTSRFRAELETFLNIYNQSLGGTWGFVPLSPSEVRHMGSQLKTMIVPELALMAEVDGRTIGAVFGLLDYNPRIKRINGRLFPFGFIRLLSRRHELKRMRVISTNVLPEYQRWGIGLVLLRGLLPKITEWGIQEIEFSWVLESNTLSRGSLERGGAKLTKTYRIYDRVAATNGH
jgi:GNAT superfamily N-acetyltransferase